MDTKAIENTLVERKARCLAQMKQAELRALWWIASATTGHAAMRTIRKGGHNGPLMTGPELVEEAMETAKRHIHQRDELAGGYCDLLREELRLLTQASTPNLSTRDN